jgi:hypothetical protein
MHSVAILTIMLRVVMLSVIRLSVVLQTVAAPQMPPTKQMTNNGGFFQFSPFRLSNLMPANASADTFYKTFFIVLDCLGLLS